MKDGWRQGSDGAMDPRHGQCVQAGESLQPPVRHGGGSAMVSVLLEIFDKLMNFERREVPSESDPESRTKGSSKEDLLLTQTTPPQQVSLTHSSSVCIIKSYITV